jgi:hypothetical protein
MTDLKRAALWYAAKGFDVLPCNGKVPLLEHGFKQATTDADTITQWWDEHPSANIGIVPGTGGLLVIDIDVKGEVDGHDSLDILEQQYGKLPLTSTAYTPSGGLHRYFRIPRDETFGNNKPAEGIDIRCHRGFVVAPPSVIDGKHYRWSSKAPVAPLPPAWIALLREKPYATPRGVRPDEPAPGVVPDGHNARVSYLRAAYDAELGKLLNAPEGDGNNQICRYGFNLAQLIEYGMSEQNIRDGAEWVFAQWNWNKRGDLAAARRTLESGIAGGKARPRGGLNLD